MNLAMPLPTPFKLPVLPSDIAIHLAEVKACQQCPEMIGPVVIPRPVVSPVYIAGQAPGPKEGELGQPFAWTAGKQLFKWIAAMGVDEETFRSRAFMAAICRCFPGKTKQGGDRVPSPVEVASCSSWMKREIELLKPELVIAVGKLAIEQLVPWPDDEDMQLKDVIGKTFRVPVFGHMTDVIPLPHPSGASTWFKVEPGKKLLAKAMRLVKKHPAWAHLTAAQ
jgi:uracil-DNA glycosylase